MGGDVVQGWHAAKVGLDRLLIPTAVVANLFRSARDFRRGAAQPIRSSNSRSRLPRDQRSTTESTEIHGKENPNQLPLSVLLTVKIFEACADFLTPDGLGSCRKRRNFGAHRSLVQSCGCGLAALGFPWYPFVMIFLAWVITRVPPDSRGGTCPWRFPAATLVLPEKEHSSIIKFLTPTITRGPDPWRIRPGFPATSRPAPRSRSPGAPLLTSAASRRRPAAATRPEEWKKADRKRGCTTSRIRLPFRRFSQVARDRLPQVPRNSMR